MFFTPQEIESVLQKVVDLYLIPKFHELKMNASGEWLQSLEVVGNSDDTGVIKGRHYTEYLTKGRPPSDRLPPVSVLEKWVNVKLGISGKQGTSMAWAIAKKIQKSGTSWHQKGGSDLVEVLESPEVLDFIRKEMTATAQVKVQQELLRIAVGSF